MASLCPSTPGHDEHEARLKWLVVGLLADRTVVRPGGILDAGANDGSESCRYAEAAPDRDVLAVEPLAHHVQHIRHRYGALANLRTLHAGLDQTRGTLALRATDDMVRDMAPRPSSRRNDSSSSTELLRVDDVYCGPSPRAARLFPAERPPRLSFAHWDLEGGELRVLEGARATLDRDRPVFTVELFPHTKRRGAPARDLLAATASLGYDSFLVEEPCGIPLDCRNVVSVPRERRRAFARSEGVINATRAGWLVEVNASSVQQFGFPCCAHGGDCCRTDSTWWTCCQPVQLGRARRPSPTLLAHWKVPRTLWPRDATKP